MLNMIRLTIITYMHLNAPKNKISSKVSQTTHIKNTNLFYKYIGPRKPCIVRCNLNQRNRTYIIIRMVHAFLIVLNFLCDKH